MELLGLKLRLKEGISDQEERNDIEKRIRNDIEKRIRILERDLKLD